MCGFRLLVTISLPQMFQEGIPVVFEAAPVKMTRPFDITHPPTHRRLVADDEAARALDRLDHGLCVPGEERAEVDELAGDALLLPRQLARLWVGRGSRVPGAVGGAGPHKTSVRTNHTNTQSQPHPTSQ